MGPPAFGEWLKRRRSSLGLTQKELASRAGYATITIRKIESGDLSPSRRLLCRIAIPLEIAEKDLDTLLRFAIGSSAVPAPVPPHALPATGILPVPLSPLIGRNTELATLLNWLGTRAMRLVTVQGPGGIGKSRIALAAGEHLQTSARRDVRYVDMEGSGPDGEAALVDRITTALGVHETQGLALIDAVASYLRQVPTVLLLDGFESVHPSANQRLAALLQLAPMTQAIVTSRVALNVRGERILPLGPLPWTAKREGANESLQSELPAAIELFVRCVRNRRPDYVLEQADRVATAEICSSLDGNPLAIELAAGQLRNQSIADLAADLSLDVLKDGPADMPARQQSMRHVLDASWRLLTPEQKIIVQQLSVLVGAASLEDIDVLCRSALAEHKASQHLAGAIDLGLIQREPSTGELTLGLSFVVRAYAFEKLKSKGLRRRAENEHFNHFLKLATQENLRIKGAAQLDAANRIEFALPNLEAALRWAFEHDTGRAQALVIEMGQWWEIRGRWREGLEWTKRALSLEDSLCPETKASLHLVEGMLLNSLGESQRVTEHKY